MTDKIFKALFPIIYLVIDGGPCAGKTSALNKIRAFCMQWGIRLIIVPEAAREYFSAIGRGASDLVVQQNLLELQLMHEDFYRRKAQEYQQLGERVLVLFDRSLLTGKAYVTDEVWKSALESMGLTESSIAARYTNFIHMVTAADGAPEFFVNDSERPETREEANVADQRLQRAPVGLAKNLTVIRNTGNLDVKIEDTWHAVLANMGLPVPIQDQSWYSIDDSFDPKTIPEQVVSVYIEQAYLSVGDVERRIRLKRLPNGEEWYFYTEKRPTGIASKRIEIERGISKSEYTKLLMERSTDHEIVQKTRHCFVHNYQYFQLDEMQFPNPGFKFKLEYTRTTENQKIELPTFLPIIEDVTGRNEYRTSTIALKKPTVI